MGEEKQRLTKEQQFNKDFPDLDPSKDTQEESWVWGADQAVTGVSSPVQLDPVASGFFQVDPSNPGLYNTGAFVREVQRMEQAFNKMGQSLGESVKAGITEEITFDPITEILLELQEYVQGNVDNHADMIGVNGQITVLFIELAELKALLYHPDRVDLPIEAFARPKLFGILYQVVCTIIELDRDNLTGAV